VNIIHTRMDQPSDAEGKVAQLWEEALSRISAIDPGKCVESKVLFKSHILKCFYIYLLSYL
jgi:hypothetical protein